METIQKFWKSNKAHSAPAQPLPKEWVELLNQLK
jgi:hypothetical protein